MDIKLQNTPFFIGGSLGGPSSFLRMSGAQNTIIGKYSSRTETWGTKMPIKMTKRKHRQIKIPSNQSNSIFLTSSTQKYSGFKIHHFRECLNKSIGGYTLILLENDFVAQINNKTKKTQVYTCLFNKHRFTMTKIKKAIQYLTTQHSLTSPTLFCSRT